MWNPWQVKISTQIPGSRRKWRPLPQLLQHLSIFFTMIPHRYYLQGEHVFALHHLPFSLHVELPLHLTWSSFPQNVRFIHVQHSTLNLLIWHSYIYVCDTVRFGKPAICNGNHGREEEITLSNRSCSSIDRFPDQGWGFSLCYR